ncbi:AcrR family transcriptional regulator [Bosea sp. OAE752]|uniref:TetR/AcrR family transcriptional regulator n=1 Tax=Bosea sp. OAE752 TaxID=2663873 RepID=UPI003D19D08C
MSQRKPKDSASESRGRIIEAATTLFTQTAFDKVSVEEIARLAGVAHGLVFHYFGTKAKLYEAVSREAAGRLDRLHIEATVGADSAPGKLANFLRSHMEAVEQRKADYVFHSRGGGSPAIQAIWEGSRRNAIHLILGFFGVQKPSEALIVATRAWLGFYDELVLEWMQGKPVSPDGIIRISLEMFSATMARAGILGASDAPDQAPID